ncbi:hypothetical protein L195_g024945 [Trifolium pratense]|uniref:Uncharacterized protein n=1 Tax=Trifolium pratense TaxID=57577 RepID=A0A2K3NF31_TRIPR|nr:uncharacterized protein LOC123891613 [Trifolium pratense]PNY01644.1 hypothetical protein L195_g024945 [Trifolium pratense]
MSSSIQMASFNKFGYQKLRHEVGYDHDEVERVIQRPKNLLRFRRIPMRRRFRLKIPSLRRLWRKKSKVVSSMRISCAKVVKRFKDGQVHFGDLFAGNYLFMQVNPSSFNYLGKEITIPKIA